MKLNIGIVGAGNFASFAASAFIKVAGVNIIAVTDINELAARKLAMEMDALVYTTYTNFLADKNIDLVYIATPPYLHYQQSKAALLTGKNVVCEKPAALNVADAEELIAIAKASSLLYVVNLMQRYNPLFAIVKDVIDQKIFGNFLHGFFENYASDENLDVQHWFWDAAKSGGIFIEHGVHFFDLFAGWLGDGKLLNAITIQRPGIKQTIVDRVQATVAYERGIVNFYHGFDQPKILDRQEMRLQFDNGEITLYEWIPVRMRLHGLLKNEQLEKLQAMLQPCEILYQDKISPTVQKVKGRFIDIIFDEHVTIEYGNNIDKQNRYQQMLKVMLEDQWNWIKNHTHHRIIDEVNAVQSLLVAEQAQAIAIKI
ncbi:Gfo/Idh/MocA family protein [Ferruginibacter sp.]|uniref:Gfo/Idh/MocA family protein n=1 Tax=Ferruginibacter sp. TaxID=1940288 RepID=UPI00374D733A